MQNWFLNFYFTVCIFHVRILYIVYEHGDDGFLTGGQTTKFNKKSSKFFFLQWVRFEQVFNYFACIIKELSRRRCFLSARKWENKQSLFSGVDITVENTIITLSFRPIRENRPGQRLVVDNASRSKSTWIDRPLVPARTWLKFWCHSPSFRLALTSLETERGC